MFGKYCLGPKVTQDQFLDASFKYLLFQMFLLISPDHNEDHADVDVQAAHWPGESDLHLIKKDLSKKKQKRGYYFLFKR